MQLISLSSNKNSFKNVHFKNETGLNFIVASQKNSESSERGNTTNGVGKSLLISIIHFCLGSNKNNGFSKELTGWSFILKFKINNVEYTSERHTDNQSKIILNNEEISLSDFKSKFENLLFDIPAETSELTFRSLISFFIRPRKSSYLDCKNPNSVKKDFQIQINNSLLLGLDVKLAQEKYILKTEKDRIKNLINELKKDDLLKDFFNQKKDSTLEAQRIGDEIVQLENDINSFKVADDYYQINKEADDIKIEIERIKNNMVLIQNQIVNIDLSLKISPDIKREKIENIYYEVSAIFNQESLKTLSELEKFYEFISSSREKRLFEKKHELIAKMKELESLISVKKSNLDDKLRYLDTHQAIDIVLKLNNKLSDLKTQELNILRYDELISSYQKAKIKAEIDFSQATQISEYYIDESKELIKITGDFFRELARRFYPNSTAGITVKNNDRDSQIRFDIDAKISADKSDGIGNIKIFCYDLTLLLKGFSHRVNFLFHDSRLLSETDPRQTAELFKILDEYVKSSGKQYILTLNQSQIDEVKKHLSEEEVQNIITQNICLELKDVLPEDKLLGIQVDMDYQ